MVRKTPLEQVPSYLKAVTILEPAGNITAETSAAVDKMRAGGRPWLIVVASAAGASVGLLLLLLLLLGPQRPNISGAKNDVERRIPQDQFDTIQANLCVTTTRGFDSETRDPIQQAKIGSAQGVNAAPRFNNTESEIRSNLEAQI
jgi:hypothetical protein